MLDSHMTEWLTPRCADVDDSVVMACKHLHENRELFEDDYIPTPSAILEVEGLEAFVRGVINENAERALFFWGYSYHLNLWDVVQIADTHASFVDLNERITEFIDRNLPRAPGADEGRWLDATEDGWVRLHPDVIALCRNLGDTATALAPDFIKRDYDLRLEPLSVVEWAPAETTRSRVRLVRRFLYAEVAARLPFLPDVVGRVSAVTEEREQDLPTYASRRIRSRFCLFP